MLGEVEELPQVWDPPVPSSIQPSPLTQTMSDSTLHLPWLDWKSDQGTFPSLRITEPTGQGKRGGPLSLVFAVSFTHLL